MATNKTQGKDPQPRRHASGQLAVRLRDANTGKRRDIYCGVYGKAESMVRYAEVVQAWKDRGRVLDAIPAPPAKPDEPRHGCVAAIALAYVRDIEHRGTMDRRHLSGLRRALGIVRSIHGSTPVSEFGPLALQEVRQAMIDLRYGKDNKRRWARKTINERVRHITNMAEWAVSQEKAPASWAHALQSVKPLKPAEFGIPEGRTVKPVNPDHVEAIREHVSSVVWAMIQVQRFTGMRAGEVCAMRAIDIDTAGDTWIYRPAQHKNQHRGHDRLVAIGAKAQDAIAPLLAGRPVHAYLFDPRESRRERDQANASKGKPRRPNQKPSQNRSGRTIGDRYTTATYYNAIRRGCELAGVPVWGTHRLRHLFATETRDAFGLEHAQAVLGDRSINMAQHYAKVGLEKAIEVAQKIG